MHRGPPDKLGRYYRIPVDPTRAPIERTAQRKKKRRSAEHDQQAALFQWATNLMRSIPALGNLFAIPNGGSRHFAEAARLKASGVKAGVPDVALAWPIRSVEQPHLYASPGLYVEMKAGKNRPTSEQLAWRERLVAAGYRYVLAYSWTQAANAIVDYLGKDYAAFRV